MFSSMLSLAMAALVSTSATLPAWQMDYRQARELAVKEQKPLAVIIGNGNAGWDKVVPMADGTATAMRSGFVCVYVDKTTTEGEKLAKAFEMGDTTGVIISDRTGDLQAYRHAGPIDESEMQRVAVRYADPAHVVRTTETTVPAPVLPPVRMDCPKCRAAQARQ